MLGQCVQSSAFINPVHINPPEMILASMQKMHFSQQVIRGGNYAPKPEMWDSLMIKMDALS